MKQTIINLLVFAAGAGIGVAATQQYFKKKYEQIAQEEIRSIKEKYSKKDSKLNNDESIDENPTPDDFDEETHEEYESIISENGYTNYSRIHEAKEKDYITSEPYVISPDEFGEDETYTQISLTYYADGVLADDKNDPIENIDDIVGMDSLTHFGEYEDDSVFVRNERLKCDYEILLDEQSYEEVYSIESHNHCSDEDGDA